MDDFAIFLLDENDYESADEVQCRKLVLPSTVKSFKILEKDWNECILIIIFSDTTIHKYAVI
jgi:hypothetical protein